MARNGSAVCVIGKPRLGRLGSLARSRVSGFRTLHRPRSEHRIRVARRDSRWWWCLLPPEKTSLLPPRVKTSRRKRDSKKKRACVECERDETPDREKKPSRLAPELGA